MRTSFEGQASISRLRLFIFRDTYTSEPYFILQPFSQRLCGLESNKLCN